MRDDLLRLARNRIEYLTTFCHSRHQSDSDAITLRIDAALSGEKAGK